MAKSESTNAMSTFMGRGAGLGANGQIENLAWLPNVITKTADYTVLAAESGSVFVTTGATAAVNFTLPAIADGPFFYIFVNGADQNMTVTFETADTGVAFNDLAADSVAYSTASEKIGGAFMVIGDATDVFVIPMGAGGHVQTSTVTS